MPRRLTVVAGEGALVQSVIAAAKHSGDTVQVLALGSRSDLDSGVVQVTIDLGEIAAQVREFRSTHVCLVGGALLSDEVRKGVARAVGQPPGGTGDIDLAQLRSQVEAAMGARLIGAHQVAPTLVVGDEVVVGTAIDVPLRAVVAYALVMARKAGRLDLGQAVVVCGRRLIATEDIGGTDALLERVGDLRKRGLFGDGGDATILAKASKPRQPSFVDLPTIGAMTVEIAAAAGVSVIAVEAGRSLIADRHAVVAAGVRLGVTVVGAPIRHG
ncbi:MAG: UDP-2,3-diacylglucosamine diphosphatase LpxI [Devosia sp.]